MPLRATINTYAYERAGPGAGNVVKRKVLANQFVGATWFGDPELTTPVEGAVEEALVYGNAIAPAGARWQVPAGDVPPSPEVTSVTPASLPLATAPPFDLTFSGSFDPEHEYEARIISADGQWTYTPSKDGEGEVVATEAEVVATFAVAPDADNAGPGTAEVEDKTAGAKVGSVPFTWEAMPPTAAVANWSPNEGPTTGGTVVSVTGSGLTGTTGVMFGDTPGVLGTVADDALDATSPAHAAESLPSLVLQHPDGDVEFAYGWTYTGAAADEAKQAATEADEAKSPATKPRPHHRKMPGD